MAEPCGFAFSGLAVTFLDLHSATDDRFFYGRRLVYRNHFLLTVTCNFLYEDSWIELVSGRGLCFPVPLWYRAEDRRSCHHWYSKGIAAYKGIFGKMHLSGNICFNTRACRFLSSFRRITVRLLGIELDCKFCVCKEAAPVGRLSLFRASSFSSTRFMGLFCGISVTFAAEVLFCFYGDFVSFGVYNVAFGSRELFMV